MNTQTPPSPEKSELIARVCRQLGEAGDALCKDPLDKGTKWLAALQPELEIALAITTDEKNAFVIFFLSLLIDDAGYNFLADFPFSEDSSDESENLARELFTAMGKGFNSLSRDLADSNFDSCVSSLVDIVSIYLRTVKGFNQLRTN